MLRFVLAVALLAATSGTVQAQGATVTSYGQGCGPVATGSVTPNGGNYRFTFTVDTTPRSRILLIVGVNPIAVPLPTTTCFLLTEPAFVQQHITSSAGLWSFSHALPGGGSYRGSARVQFIRVDFAPDGSISLVPSNGLFMDCSGLGGS